MTAVIGPVSVQHADLGHGRIAVLVFIEIVLDKPEIVKSHREAEAVVQLLQRRLAHFAETVQYRDIRRFGIICPQRLGLL